MNNSEGPVIKLNSLTKRFASLTAVNNLSLEINKGETFGFLGPNGAGKTTTIRLILNFLRPTSGTVSLFGEDVSNETAKIMQRIGYIAGDIALYDDYSVAQFLDYCEALQGGPTPLRKQLVSKLDLELTRKIGQLSKGNKQKVAIVQAFMTDPGLLILDEPTSGLDPLLQLAFYDLLSEFKSRGKTIFFSSHILSEVQRVCDRVGLIKNGSLVAVKNINDLAKSLPYELDVTFKQEADLRKFIHKQLTRLSADKTTAHYSYNGDINELIKLLARFNFHDIQIKEANVEDFLLHYYTEKHG